jgi:creatinine amidohydrolase
MLLELCTWPEVEAYLDHSTGIILPHGSTEQHGPSGPFGTDWICAAAIARGIGERTGALVGPTIGLGANQFNLAFPGTISLRATTLMALVTDYVDSLAGQGFTRFYVLNGHGGNVAPLRAAWHDLHTDRRHPGIRTRLRSWWELPTVNQLRQELYGAHEGMHATPSEIAITQHLHPRETIDMAPAETLSAAYLRDHAGDQHDDAEAHRRRFPDGRIGSDPGLATPEQGKRLLEAAIADGVADYTAFLAET